MQQFELVLRNEKRKFYDRFAILLFILNGIAICIFLAKSNYQLLSQQVFPGFFGLAVTLFLIGMIIFNKNSRQLTYSFPIASFCIVLFWFYMQYWWAGLIMFALLSLYMVSKKELRVIVEDDHIVYPTFPKRWLNWNELNNIILKDGLLTIDFKNNRLIQQPIDEKGNKVNEQEFNDFCKKQLAAKS